MQLIMFLKNHKIFVRFIPEHRDFMSDVIFLKDKLISSDLCQVVKILRQKVNLCKQNGCLTRALWLTLFANFVCLQNVIRHCRKFKKMLDIIVTISQRRNWNGKR